MQVLDRLFKQRVIMKRLMLVQVLFPNRGQIRKKEISVLIKNIGQNIGLKIYNNAELPQ